MASAAITVAGTGDLTRYLQEIRNFPMLSLDEEQSLARRWRDQQDLPAAHALVTSHLRFVAKIAMRYRGYNLPLGELIGEGNIGLMQAVQRFDPDRGFRLSTYALWWIRAALNDYVLRSWSLVKMGTTAAQRKLFFNLRRLKGEMHAIDAGELQPEQVAAIARTLAVAEGEVVSMNHRLAAPDYSLNAPVGQDNEGEWQDWLADDRSGPEADLAEQEETHDRATLLSEALKTLRDRERHILTERRLKEEPTTLETLGRHYGISRERVRQIEARAFEKLQKAMKAAVAARAARALPSGQAASAALPALLPGRANAGGVTV